MKNIFTPLAVAASSVVLTGLLASSAFAIMPADVREAKETRLQENKLRVCQNREDSIKRRSSNLVKFSNNMIEKFDAIAERVKNYYTTKVVPSGTTVANYDALLADITAKKTAVQTAITKAQTDVNNFTCTGTDPKGNLTQFRDDMQAVKSALKDYRTSIKNLIVAVRGSSGQTNNQ